MKNKMAQVVIVGRANTGKSTLFNRLVEKDKAIVSSVAGTTRDRNIDEVFWRGKKFTLVDTGGLDVDKKLGHIIDENIVKQAKQAIKKANLILFVADIQDNITPVDRELAGLLIKEGLKKKIILVANKADSPKHRQDSGGLYKLNLDEPQFISAANGSGCGDLLDLILKRLPPEKLGQKEEAHATIRVAIVGKPNAGKSSLVNSILGEERVIVTPLPHTTRESHDTEFIYNGVNFTLIDTAGISKITKLKTGSLERKSIEKSLDTIKEADAVVLLLEAQRKIDAQDKKITQTILENSKPLVIIVNKWDLILDKNTNTIKQFTQYYRAALPYLWWAPIMFISALENQRTKKILDTIVAIKKSSETVVTDGALENFLKNRIKKHRPSRGQGLKNPYIYKIEQIGINPPRFSIQVNDPRILHFSYIRFLQNSLREKFNIVGTPIQIELIKKPKPNDKK